jgi:hypothetical protein
LSSSKKEPRTSPGFARRIHVCFADSCLFRFCSDLRGEDFFIESLAAPAVSPDRMRDSTKAHKPRVVTVLVEDLSIAILAAKLGACAEA